MRWRGERQSDNVEDRRGMPISRGAKVGGISGLGLVALVVVGLYLGIDPATMLQIGQNMQPPSVSTEQNARPAANDDMRNFVAVVLAETEDVWNATFAKFGKTYQEPKLVLFSEQLNPRAAWPDRLWGLFTVQLITRCILILISLKSFITSLAHPAISPRLTLLPMR
jgi:hypothetical protein